MVTISKKEPGAYEVHAELWLPHPRDEVFSFFADAINLEALTPTYLQFRVKTPPPIEMREGLLIDYALKLHGFPMRWQSEITVWDPPHRFVDEQRHGPYRKWVHVHSFKEEDEGTVVTDHVEYDVPGGALVNRLFIQPNVQKIFDYRHERLKDFFNV